MIRRLIAWGSGDPQSWAGHAILAAAIVMVSAPLVGVVAGVWAAFLHFLIREIEQDFHHNVVDSVLDYISPLIAAGLAMTSLYTLGFWWTLLFVAAAFVLWCIWFLVDGGVFDPDDIFPAT